LSIAGLLAKKNGGVFRAKWPDRKLIFKTFVPFAAGLSANTPLEKIVAGQLLFLISPDRMFDSRVY